MPGQLVLESPANDSERGPFALPKSGRDVLLGLLGRDELEEAARRAAPSPDRACTLASFEARPYSAEKVGFLASHYSLAVELEAGRRRRRRRRQRRLVHVGLFAKVVPHEVPAQAALVAEKGCFAKESGFFGRLLPLLTGRYAGEPWAPRCYIAKPEIVVLEDLRLSGFAVRGRTLDGPSLASAADCVARLHACSLLAEEQMDGKPLNELYPELLKESEFVNSGRIETWCLTAINLAVCIANDLGLDSSFIHRAGQSLFGIGKPSTTKRNVLSHGDLWSSNLMFDKDDRCKLIDFQLIRYAPLAHDLMQLIYLTTTRDFRQKYERQILEHYYASLRKCLSSNMYQGIVPPFEEVLQGAEEQRLPAVITAVIFHPSVLMNGKTAASILGDPATYESYSFVDRKPFVYEIMTGDPEYEKIIKDEVKELVELSLRIDTLPQLT